MGSWGVQGKEVQGQQVSELCTRSRAANQVSQQAWNKMTQDRELEGQRTPLSRKQDSIREALGRSPVC